MNLTSVLNRYAPSLDTFPLMTIQSLLQGWPGTTLSPMWLKKVCSKVELNLAIDILALLSPLWEHVVNGNFHYPPKTLHQGNYSIFLLGEQIP